MTTLDMNVSNYTLSELMAIVELEDLEPQDIMENTNYYIRKYKNKNPTMAVFFKEIQSQLLQYADGLEEDTDDENISETRITVEGFGNMSNEAVYPAGDKQVSDWYTNQNLTQSDENQTNKITDRKQKIQVFGNEKVPMNREQIATTDTFSLPVKQDSLNPNLKNTINRFINLDSQFRQYTSGPDSQSTNYTCDLSDTLKNALKLSLYSYQIPFSWYVIDTAYGNTCLWISDPSSGIIIPVSIPPGNYTYDKFITQLNLSFFQSGFTFPARTNTTLYPSPPYPSPALDSNTPAYYNPNNGLLTLFLADGSYNGIEGSFNITEQTQIIFYDFTGSLQCNVNCYSKNNHYFNNTLGWIMGYRIPYLNVDISGNTGGAVLDLNGTKYLLLVIDDYNQNHVNNSLVSISQFSNTLKMPSYYSPDIPYTCLTPKQQGNNLNELVNGVVTQSLLDNQTPNAQNGLLIAGKYQQDYTSTQIVLPSAPRTLTNAQLYTINSINANNNNLTNYLSKAPTSPDVLAIIPVKTSVGVPTGTLLVEFSGSLQDSERTYFGPVNIERLAVKLIDDKGNILNLNGSDWCVSLIAECLYQY
jgi:hypothetical protein